jgi:hypothetical protein
VPHPRLHERAFVLVPLADVAPGLVHPVLRRRVSSLRAAIDDRGVRPARPEGGRGRGRGKTHAFTATFTFASSAVRCR